MTKKLALFFLSLGILLIVFLLTEEKKEYQSEEVYWKKKIESISYYPPKKDWKEFSNTEFLNSNVEFFLVELGGFASPNIFYVKDPSQNIIYEGGYNVRNLFSDLSVFKIKSILQPEKEYLKEYSIDEEKSPYLELKEKNGSTIKLILGKELKDKSLYTLYDGKYILTTSAYVLRRFQNKPISFRERNIIHTGNEYIKRIIGSYEKYQVDIENRPSKNPSGGNQNNWRRNSGVKIVIEPRLGDDLDSVLKSLRVEKFPDEENDGLIVANELLKVNPESTWNISIADGREIQIQIYPKTWIGDMEYNLLVRTVNKNYQESPVYVSHRVVQRMIESAEKIRNAEPWQKPSKKIQ